MDQAGISQLSLVATGFTFAGLSGLSFPGGAELSLRRDPATRRYALHVEGTASLANVFNAVRLTGDLDQDGFGSLHASAEQISLRGFTVNNPSFDLVHPDAATLRLRVNGGTVGFLGNTLTLPDAELNLKGGVLKGDLTLTVARPGRRPAPPFRLPGSAGLPPLTIAGTLGLHFAPGEAAFTIHGTVAIPGLLVPGGGAIGVNGSLGSDGTGSLSVTADRLAIGAAGSGVVLSGAFTLTRQPDGTTGFAATGVKLNWAGFALDLNDFTIDSAGNFSTSLQATTLGTSSLSIQDAAIRVQKTGPGLGNFSVSVRSGKIQMPFGSAVKLPDVDFQSGGQGFLPGGGSNITLPGLNLNGFGIDDAKFKLYLAAGTLHADLTEPVGLHVVQDNNLTLQSMKMDSGGSFSAKASGKLTFFGKELGEGTFDVTLADGLATLSTQGDGLSFRVGGIDFHLTGFIRSDGRFRLSGSVGPFTVTFDNEHGYSGP
jgi:hypothetical protein